MDKGFHPVSGDVIYIATELEKQFIDEAIKFYLSCSQQGELNG